MTTLDDLRRKAEAVALGEAAFLSEPGDIDLKSFVEEDPAGQAALDANAVHKATVGKKYTRKSAHWASGAFAPCIRKEWYDFHGVKSTDKGANFDIFGMGNAVEDLVVNKYMLAGQLVRTQEYITIIDPRLKMPITGKADLIISEDGENLAIVEVKSTKDFAEREGWEKWKTYLPRKEHVAQLTLYLHAMGLPMGYIAYMNKQRQITIRYRVVYNEKFYDAIVMYFKQLEDALIGLEPEIPKGITGKRFPCVWWSQDRNRKVPVGMCNYFSRCWAEHDISLAFPNEER